MEFTSEVLDEIARGAINVASRAVKDSYHGGRGETTELEHAFVIGVMSAGLLVEAVKEAGGNLVNLLRREGGKSAG